MIASAGVTAVRVIPGARGPLRVMPGACTCWTHDGPITGHIGEHCCLRGLPPLDDDEAWDRIITGDDPHCGHVVPVQSGGEPS